MQLTPQEQQLFEQLGHSAAFISWLTKAEAAEIQVLKKNAVSEQIYRAQGALGLIDKLRAVSGLNK